MQAGNGWGPTLNCFALVSYLPEPLAQFVDSLRRDFHPLSRAKAHVTVLPPRPLLGPPEKAWAELTERLQAFQPFKIELGPVETFRETLVLYLSVLSGFHELERMHEALNTGSTAFQEPYLYHPHITIAQELTPDALPAAREEAARRWAQFSHPRAFMLDRLTFVQNTIDNRWKDLAALDLASHVAR
jgi:2'-5' RNA ligase